jgi:hypothetical protein
VRRRARRDHRRAVAGHEQHPRRDKRAIDALEASGLREVMLGGAHAFACAEGESSRHFSAINAQGKRVEGTVCCGLTGVGKSCTIRW